MLSLISPLSFYFPINSFSFPHSFLSAIYTTQVRVFVNMFTWGVQSRVFEVSPYYCSPYCIFMSSCLSFSIHVSSHLILIVSCFISVYIYLVFQSVLVRTLITFPVPVIVKPEISWDTLCATLIIACRYCFCLPCFLDSGFSCPRTYFDLRTVTILLPHILDTLSLWLPGFSTNDLLKDLWLLHLGLHLGHWVNSHSLCVFYNS